MYRAELVGSRSLHDLKTRICTLITQTHTSRRPPSVLQWSGPLFLRQTILSLLATLWLSSGRAIATMHHPSYFRDPRDYVSPQHGTREQSYVNPHARKRKQDILDHYKIGDIYDRFDGLRKGTFGKETPNDGYAGLQFRSCKLKRMTD